MERKLDQEFSNLRNETAGDGFSVLLEGLIVLPCSKESSKVDPYASSSGIFVKEEKPSEMGVSLRYGVLGKEGNKTGGRATSVVNLPWLQ